MAKGRHWPVAGNKRNVITQRPEPTTDRCNQRIKIAFWKIGTPDRALKKHIADNGQTTRFMKENQVSRRVTGAMDYTHFDISEMHRVTLLQPAIRRERTHVWETEHFALLGHAVDPELIIALRPFNRQRKTFGKFGHCTGMIDMAVCHENLLQRCPALLKRPDDALNIPARINHRRTAGFFAPQQAAVLLKGRNGNNFIFHQRRAHRRGIQGVTEYSRSDHQEPPREEGRQRKRIALARRDTRISELIDNSK